MLPETFFEQPAYKLFRQAFAERKAPLVIVCGAGLSAPALPTWTALRRKLEQEAAAKAANSNQLGQRLLQPKVEAAREQNNFWVAFKLLKQILTRPTFEELIRQFLEPEPGVASPVAYRDLLRLEPRGLVTLNLDRFAGRSMAEANRREPLIPINGKEIARKWQDLRASKPYLVQIHGSINDASTWVMTQDDLEELTSSDGHRHFLTTLYMDHVVLFAGVSADDLALSKRLLELANAGFRPTSLYWFTNRLDPDVGQWADNVGVNLILYQARSSEEHHSALHEFVDDCLQYIARDVVQPPSLGSSDHLQPPSKIVSDPHDLAQRTPDEVRYALAFLLDDALRKVPAEGDLLQAYRDFCHTYSYPVHNAFYKDLGNDQRFWFGYELQHQLGRGNFGEVFSANHPSGELVAVKIMNSSIFDDDAKLAGFRRGVRSLEIITRNKVPGMITMRESFELPPTIVMPFVPGESLEGLLRSASLPWLVKLDILRKIGIIVARAHALPETVLHRDIKPSNIMVKNPEYGGYFDADVVVLDFDMSWHNEVKDERDVIFESRNDFGYLAPEQTDPNSRYRPRNTKVDSYGFGMTIYFTFGLNAPRPNEALSPDWQEQATRAAKYQYEGQWRSAPFRIGRLIARATQIDQRKRLDFVSILHQLTDIQCAVTNPAELRNSELWAEEVLARLTDINDYTWDDISAEGASPAPGGMRISCSNNFSSGRVRLLFGFIDSGDRERSALIKYLPGAIAGAEGDLKRGGWSVTKKQVGGRQAAIEVECPIAQLQQHSAEAIGAATQAANHFRRL